MRIQFFIGNARVVFIIGNIVIKIARIKIVSCFQRLQFYWLEKEAHALGTNFGSRLLFFLSAMRFYPLYDGFRENIREFYVYWRTKSELLSPTYFSLGLINVGSFIEGVGVIQNCDKEENKILNQFFINNKKFIGNYSQCAHTFENPKNIAMKNGKIIIVDYGQPGFYELISQYESELTKFFDILINKQ
jgi:hypothetical protein